MDLTIHFDVSFFSQPRELGRDEKSRSLSSKNGQPTILKLQEPLLLPMVTQHSSSQKVGKDFLFYIFSILPDYSMTLPPQNNDVPIGHRRKSFISSIQGAMSTNNQKADRAKPYTLISRCYAEFLGTFIFIFSGTMQANVYDISQPEGLTHAALTHGLATIVVIAVFGKISGGHFNPVVSWAMVLCQRLPPLALPFYMASQFFGGFCGNLLSACLQRKRDFLVWENYSSIRYTLPSEGLDYGYDKVHNSTYEKTILLTTQLSATSSGITHLGVNHEWWEGLMSETITTYFFVTVILMMVVDGEPKEVTPLIIGMMVIVNIFATASITGTAMNPVRALSPNVVAEIVLSSSSLPAKFWTYHYIYWAGPFLGSTIAVLGYKLLLSKNDRLVP